MGAICLTRKDYEEGMTQVDEACVDGAYLDKFKINFPDGLRTASTMEICKLISQPDMEAKVRLMRVCIQGKNVEVTCPNGEVEKFCMMNLNDTLEGFPLFQKEPMALMAISDAICGYILKKYVRLSTAAQKTAGKQV